MAKDHFVPRHYLRCFGVNGSEEIVVSKVSPYRCLGRKGIGGQCQTSDFYEGDQGLEGVIWQAENDLAPVLARVVEKETMTEQELVALRWLAVTLHVRTKKMVNAAKVFPKRVAREVLGNAIERGEIPPPPAGERLEDIIDFKGVPGSLFKSVVLTCALEMHTLNCKLLKAGCGAFFLTSDNPVLRLNQFSSKALPFRSHAGFAKAGFQLLLPISPNLCLFFFDPRVYKVGCRRESVVMLTNDDAETVNAIQIQSADETVIFHDPNVENEVRRLVDKYARFRVPVQDCLRTYPSECGKGQLLHSVGPFATLPRPWTFCHKLRHVKLQIGDYRKPAWTALVEELETDLKNNPNGGDIHERIRRIIDDPSALKQIRLR
jgi:hypothetical protein